MTKPTIHTFASSGEAYDRSQTNDEIRDGDILSVPGECVVGILVEAWPTSISEEAHGAFHTRGWLRLERPASSWLPCES